MNRIKWIAVTVPALFVGLFEYVRHQVFHDFPIGLGNIMAAVLAGGISLLYYYGLFALVQNLNSKLQQERESNAVLQERDRIARELHDSVAQAIFFLNIKLRELERRLQAHADEVPEEIDELRKAVKLMNDDVRQHIFNLQLASQPEHNLTVTLQNLVTGFKDQSGIDTDLILHGNVDQKALSDSDFNHLIRMLQEVFWNIRKHADALKVCVELRVSDGRISISIKDDGVGFHMEKADMHTYGLRIVKERARLMDAQLTIHTSPGQGTEVLIELKRRDAA